MLGRLRDIIPIGRKSVITLELDALAAEMEKYTGKELSVEIEPFKAHKTLSQNAYYWVLLTKVAAHREIMTSSARQHNLLLRLHPRYEIISGKMVTVYLPDTDEAEEEALEAVTYHLMPSDITHENSKGVRFRTYFMLRGSKTYNTQEMSVLLDDLIERAKDLGIDTITPEERERMRLYDERQSKQRQGKAV